MLNSKQRAALRGIASNYETIFQIGKGGISETLISQVDDALRKRELIKLRVLDNSMYTAREAAEEPTEYYTMKYSGEEIDELLDKVAAM